MKKQITIKTCSFIMLLCLITGGISGKEEADGPAAQRYLAAYESMEMADWLTSQNMPDEAQDTYKEALRKFRGLANEYPGWQNELIQYRIKHCISQIEKINIVEQKPEKATDDTVAVTEALKLELMPDLKNAVTAYTKILKRQPNNQQAIKGALRCYLRIGEVDSARTLIQESIQEPVSDSDLLLLMALVECHDHQFDRAIQLLRLALDDNRRNAHAYVAMGIALAGQGRFDSAENEMKRALSINSRLSEAYYNLAWISFRMDPSNTAVVRTHYTNALRYGGETDPLLERLFN